MCSSHVNTFGRLAVEAAADGKPDVTIGALTVSKQVIESTLNLLWKKVKFCVDKKFYRSCFVTVTKYGRVKFRIKAQRAHKRQLCI